MQAGDLAAELHLARLEVADVLGRLCQYGGLAQLGRRGDAVHELLFLGLAAPPLAPSRARAHGTQCWDHIAQASDAVVDVAAVPPLNGVVCNLARPHGRLAVGGWRGWRTRRRQCARGRARCARARVGRGANGRTQTRQRRLCVSIAPRCHVDGA